MTLPNPNIRICDFYRNLYVKLNFRIPKGTLSVFMLICAFTAIPKVGLGIWSKTKQWYWKTKSQYYLGNSQAYYKTKSSYLANICYEIFAQLKQHLEHKPYFNKNIRIWKAEVGMSS